MAEKHYYEQLEYSEIYLIPYLGNLIGDFKNFKVLEIGCAEAGVIKALNDYGVAAEGIELEESRVVIAKEKNPELNVSVGDITDRAILQEREKKYDLIIMRDVIEHIENREAAFQNILDLLAENGYLFITFPPRFSGFAGHQQNGKSILKWMPYLHLLPDFLIRALGKLFNEREALIEHVIENYKIGLSLRNFRRHYKSAGFDVFTENLFLTRPIFKLRYGVKTIRFPNIFFLNEFFALGCEALLKKADRKF